MTESARKDNFAEFIKNLIIGFLIVFITTYCIVYQQTDSGDFVTHIKWAQQFNFHYLWEYLTKVVPYPLWHFTVKASQRVFDIEWGAASAFITALFNGGSYIVTVFAGKALFEKFIDKAGKYIFWITCLMYVGPLYAPWFNKNYYIGQGTGNIWHNPTNICVKLFAIIAFILIVQVLQKEKNEPKKLIFLSVTLFFSTLAKPAFLQGIIPGLGLYMVLHLICDKQNRKWEKYFLLIASFIPSVIILFLQLCNTMYGSTRGNKLSTQLAPGEQAVEKVIERGIGIAWGKTLDHWTPNIYFSFVLAFAFPIFVFLFNRRKMIKDKAVQLVLCFETAAWLESIILYQKGAGEHQGNFFWASYLSMYMVWMVTVYYFIGSLKELQWDRTRDRIYVIGGVILFVTHLIFGLFYYMDFFII